MVTTLRSRRLPAPRGAVFEAYEIDDAPSAAVSIRASEAKSSIPMSPRSSRWPRSDSSVPPTSPSHQPLTQLTAGPELLHLESDLDIPARTRAPSAASASVGVQNAGTSSRPEVNLLLRLVVRLLVLYAGLYLISADGEWLSWRPHEDLVSTDIWIRQNLSCVLEHFPCGSCLHTQKVCREQRWNAFMEFYQESVLSRPGTERLGKDYKRILFPMEAACEPIETWGRLLEWMGWNLLIRVMRLVGWGLVMWPVLVRVVPCLHGWYIIASRSDRVRSLAQSPLTKVWRTVRWPTMLFCFLLLRDWTTHRKAALLAADYLMPDADLLAVEQNHWSVVGLSPFGLWLSPKNACRQRLRRMDPDKLFRWGVGPMEHGMNLDDHAQLSLACGIIRNPKRVLGWLGSYMVLGVAWLLLLGLVWSQVRKLWRSAVPYLRRARQAWGR